MGRPVSGFLTARPIHSWNRPRDTTLALHPASEQNPAGSTHLGFVAAEIDRMHRELVGRGVTFTRAPTPEHGVKLAEFLDSEGARCSLSG